MSKHEEFPELTPEARAAYFAAIDAIQNSGFTISPNENSGFSISPNDFRRAIAACLREAIRQAGRSDWHLVWGKLEAIANNLHNPLPTLAQARAADLTTPEGQATARAFLATLGEAGQP